MNDFYDFWSATKALINGFLGIQTFKNSNIYE